MDLVVDVSKLNNIDIEGTQLKATNYFLICNLSIVLLYFLQIQDIVQMQQLLTVFRIDEENNNDVDVAILQAFLKGAVWSNVYVGIHLALY